MKRAAFFIIAVLSLVFFVTSTDAQSNGNGNRAKVKLNWVDLNGDGICDNVGTANQGSLNSGKGYGKKDGTGNGLRPQDGTGFGKKGGNATISGVRDGTGPKGSNARRGRK